MTLSRIKTWISGEILTASDLNSEFNNILNNASSLISPVTFTGTVTMSNAAVNEAQGSTIASAATTDIGAATGNYVIVSGTTTITGLGTVQAGARRTVEFSGKLKITYNASTLILPGAVDYYTTAGDVLQFVSEGSGVWRCVSVTPSFAVPDPNTGPKNALINGSFEICQRGAEGSASFSLSASTLTNIFDRWWILTTTNNATTVTQATGLVSGSRFAAKVLRNAGQTGTGLIRIEQALTLDQIVPLRGQFITVSAVISTGANYSGTVIGIRCKAGTGAAGRLSNGTYTSETSLIDANASVSAGASAATFVQRSTAVVPTGATQMAIQFNLTPSGTAGADDSITIDDVQLEIGVRPSVYERRSYTDEIVQCARFYQKSFPAAAAPAQSGGVTGATTVYLPTGASGTFGVWIPLSRRMYQTPTVTTYNPSAANANWRDVTGGADRTLTQGTHSDASLLFTGAAGVAATTNQIHWQADAELT